MNEPTVIQSPVRTPTEQRVRANGIELATFHWRGSAGAGPTIFFAHATGFHARVWDPVIRHLPEYDVVAVDLRGHGRSTKLAIEHWDDLGRDLAVLAAELQLEGAVGVGHSMGAHALVDAAASAGNAFACLLLVDPVIQAPDVEAAGGFGDALPEGEPHPASKRKGRFSSPDAMIERFRDRVPYSVFTPEALRCYCEHGLLPAPNGDGYALACPPEIEASVYMSSRSNPGVHDSVRSLSIPVTVLRAKERAPDGDAWDFGSSPTWPELASVFADGRDVHLPEQTHFLPMEAPELVARYVARAAAGVALATPVR